MRVLAMSKVVIEKLDYKEHLVGNTRRELVDLDKLPGRFWVTNTKVVVERFKEKGRKVHRFICTSTIRVSLTVKILKSLMMHEFKKELKSINLSYSMLDFLASKTDFVIEEIPGRERAWAVGETNLRLDQPNRDGNCNQVQRDMLRTASWCWPRSV